MGKVTAQLSMSLDGYIAGPNVTLDNPMGDGGEELHEWVFGLKSWREPQGLEGGSEGTDDEVAKENLVNKGAVVMGRTMFDLGEIPWGDDPPYHNPVFVVTSRLGGGTRLFDNLQARNKFEIVRVIGSPEITHVKYRIGGPRGRVTSENDSKGDRHPLRRPAARRRLAAG